MSEHQKLLFTNDVPDAVERLIAGVDTRGGLFIVADTNTAHVVVPSLVAAAPSLAQARVITIEAGDRNKTVGALANVWQALSDSGATRHAALINVGGGMVTDLGGMAASTFKRGIPFINVPTTLLGAVDAAVGGKTGVNLGNLKNEVGVFNEAVGVVISSCYFATLPDAELLSGYGEMLKHGLLSGSPAFDRLLARDVTATDSATMLSLLEESVRVKRDIVVQDPTEQGLRRALNLGHTAGHAIETLALDSGRPIPHGVAVAQGLMVALVLSHTMLGFPSDIIHRYAAYMKGNYPRATFACRDYDRLIELMRHDKKNVTSDDIAFTLLRSPGDIVTGRVVAPAEITAALDITLDFIG